MHVFLHKICSTKAVVHHLFSLLKVYFTYDKPEVPWFVLTSRTNEYTCSVYFSLVLNSNTVKKKK